jgi:putative ABC transport system permease protein
VFRTALKSLFARKFRLLTTGIAIVLGVAFVAGTMTLTDTISRTFDGLFSEVFAGTDGMVRAEEPFEVDNGAGSTRPRVDASLVEAIAAVPGVAYAEGDTFQWARIVGKDGETLGQSQGPPTFGGGWSSNDELNTWDLVEGRAPRTATEIVIDRGSADDGDLAPGDRTQVLTRAGPIDVTVVGVARFGDYDSPGGTTFAGFTPAAAQQYLGEPGKFDSISVVAEDGLSQAELRTRLAAVLPDGIEAITGEQLVEENREDLQFFIDLIGNSMLAFALIALFVGSFIIYNTFSILVAQRTRENALLRAIGATKRQVLSVVMIEALAVGLVASIVGIGLGILVAVGLKALLVAFGLDLPAEGLAVDASTVIISLALGTIVTTFVAWFPARRGAKVPPIAAMRDVAIEQRGRPRLRIAFGVLLGALGLLLLVSGLFGNSDNPLPSVGLGALLLLLGVTALGPLVARPVVGIIGRPLALRGTSGVLARENAMRNPRRTSSTASALMIGVALVSFITIFAASVKASMNTIFDEQFTGDYVLDSESFGFGGMSTDMADRLRELPELEAVSALRIGLAELDGEGVMLQALDAAEIGGIAEIDVQQGSLDDLDATSIAVLDEKAADEGWRIGSTVPVRFANTGLQQLTIKVIYGNEELAEKYWVDTSVFDANITDQFDTLVFANAADGTSDEEARRAIETVSDDFANAKLQSRAEFIDAQSGFIDLIVNLIYVLLALAVIIALFGIANTLALSMVERTRELGLLRAVGMTRGQLRSMVRWEAALIALFGTLGGLGMGIFFGWAMFQALEEEGFRTFEVPAGSLLVITVFAAFFGVVAALLPARRAARLNVLAAIATD